MNATAGIRALDSRAVDILPWNVPPRRSNERLKMYSALVTADFVALSLAFAAATVWWLSPGQFDRGVWIMSGVAALYFVIALNGRAYSLYVCTRPTLGCKRALKSIAITIATALGIAFFMKISSDFSRVVLASGTVLTAALIVCLRMATHRLLGRRLRPSLVIDVLILDGVEVDTSLCSYVLDTRALQLTPTLSNPTMMDRLGRALKNADRVVVACPEARREAWALVLKGMNIDVEICAPELNHIGVLGTGRFGEGSTLRVACGPLDLQQRMLKRTLDLAIVLIVLPILLPLLALIAIAIKLETPGPVFFVQQRIGLGNRLFPLFKFRSMKVEQLDATASVLTGRDDDRVTRVGRILRASSLDELPQILNVLLGTMSVTGPRPHATGARAGDALYWEVDERYWDRHAIKPGMTGLAQIRGFRGTTFQRSDLTNRLQADFDYLTDWTVWRDIAIILGTVRVLVHRNAF